MQAQVSSVGRYMAVNPQSHTAQAVEFTSFDAPWGLWGTVAKAAGLAPTDAGMLAVAAVLHSGSDGVAQIHMSKTSLADQFRLHV